MQTNYYSIGKDFELKRKDNLLSKKKKIIKPMPVLLMDVGFYIIMPLLIAVPIGLYIDRWLKTRNIFTLILIFLGFSSTIYNLIRLTKK